MLLLVIAVCCLVMFAMVGAQKPREALSPASTSLPVTEAEEVVETQVRQELNLWNKILQAVMLQKEDTMAALLRSGPFSVNLRDHNDLTLLHYAAGRPSSKIVELLLQHEDINPGVIGGPSNCVAANSARQFGRYDNLWLLLKRYQHKKYLLPYNCNDHELEAWIEDPDSIPRGNNHVVLKKGDFLFGDELRWEKVISEIDATLFISGGFAAAHPASLKKRGITSVINLSGELHLGEALANTSIKETRIPLNDHQQENILLQLPGIIKLILTEILSGQVVLLNCWMGYSRSGTALVAYFMVRHRLGVLEALGLARHFRPMITPNSGFMKQLKQFELSEELQDLRRMVVIEGRELK